MSGIIIAFVYFSHFFTMILQLKRVRKLPMLEGVCQIHLCGWFMTLCGLYARVQELFEMPKTGLWSPIDYFLMLQYRKYVATGTWGVNHVGVVFS